MPTLVIGDQHLHSKYNPQEEARRILTSDFFQTAAAKQGCIFAGIGLGYLAIQYMIEQPDVPVTIIEPDIHTFVCFLAAASQTAFFRHEQLSLLIGISPEEASSFLTSANLNSIPLFKHTVSIAVHNDWYTAFFTLRERTRTKNSINAKTLERFGTLWLKNTVKNLHLLYDTAKIRCFRNAFSGIPVLVLAAGPSLHRQLAVIKKTPQNYLIIAVDTAVRACAHEGIVPDFILSFDPQYWNYLHTAGLDTSKSVLISEAAAFPAVFRQRYRAVFLSESSVPFARFLEQDTAEDCALAAGGSVATTAWDFARYIGAQTVIMAGFDLAFPHNQTHFAGSTFEESAHNVSSRLLTAEQTSCRALYSAFPSLHADYSGGTVLTDRRMLMYAWWFESTLVKYPDIKTYNLMPEGILIPGMPACTANEFFHLTVGGMVRTDIQSRIRRIIDTVYSESFFTALPKRKQHVADSVRAMAENAASLSRKAAEAEKLCERLQEEIDTHSRVQQTALVEQLNGIDTEIRSGFAKNLVEVLFFAAENTQAESAAGTPEDSEPMKHAQAVYQRIRETALQVYEVFTRAKLTI